MLSTPIWCLIICCVILHSHLLSTLPIFAAGLEFLPLWNDIPNTSQPCVIDNSTAEQGFVTFHGSPYLTCSLQVTSSQHVLIEITGGFTRDDFFFIDKLNDCKNRYLAVQGVEQPCNVSLITSVFHVNLMSNMSISLSAIDTTKSSQECTGLHQNTGSLPSSCSKIQEFRKVYKCDGLQDIEVICRVNFPANCRVSLGKFKASLECANSVYLTEDVMLAFHSFILHLHLSGNSIASIEANAFSNLMYLQELYLDQNQLEELHPHVFTGLVNLKLLSIRENHLSTLESTVFRDLVSLEKLDLTSNKLVILPPDLLHGLITLMDIQFTENLLQTLDGSFFSGLTEVHTIILSHNNLTSLPNGLIQGLNSLTHFFMIDNVHLKSMPPLLFGGTDNIVQLSLFENALESLPIGIFENKANLVNLLLFSNALQSLSLGTFNGLVTLNILQLHNNLLQDIPEGIFQDLQSLKALTFQNNELVSLDDDVFKGLHNLDILTLHFNKLEALSQKVFYDLRKLRLLRLNSNQLSTLDHDLFKNQERMTFLDISDNRFLSIPVSSQRISQLTIFAISQNPFEIVNEKTLSGLTNESSLLVSQNEICECYAPKEVSCSAEDDRSPYLTCDRLLSDRFLVVVMWVIGILSIAGNLFVIVWKQSESKGSKVQSVLLTNLAISDFLMGVYMIILAVADIHFGNNFPLQSEKWRSGITCRVAGTLSILSSEASVFFVTLISIDRFLHVLFPFSTKNLNKMSVVFISVLTWIFALILALVPNILSGQNFKFYDNSHVCIGFPLAQLETFTKYPIDPITWEGIKFLFFSKYTVSNGFSKGLYYSTALFLGLNCLCYLIILGCYIAIMRTVKASSKRSGRSQDMNTQIKLTIKVTAIVATDFLCWFPIIILGILVQAGAITLPPSVFAWLVTCVLPINSAVNPYLYTISDIITKQRKKSESVSMKTQSSIDNSKHSSM